jgi:hypothetical protein
MNDIDTQSLTAVAHQAIHQVLVRQGHIELPAVDTHFDDDHQQRSYEFFITASVKYLEYLQAEAFVALVDDKYVLRTQDDLESEIGGI